MTVDPNHGDDRDLLEELVAEALALEESGDAAAVAALLMRQLPATAARVRDALSRLRAMPGFGDTTALAGFPSRLGDFRLLRRLGGGGMGVVFLAEQESLHRHVAVKVVRAELLELPGVRERFHREVAAIARMQHPGIVPVIAVGEQDELPYLAMELVAGRSAADVLAGLQTRDPASLRGSDLQAAIRAGDSASQDDSSATAFQGSWPEACVRVVVQVAEAIAHAHGQGIVHRDLKPSNVMLTATGRALVLDFGLAHVRGGARLTRTGGGGGSPLYMSPEQLLCEPTDERTDVYSLGVTLYELLALQPPFPASDEIRMRDALLAGHCTPVRHRNRSVPRELAVVVHKAMEPDRSHRYADMQSFAADLRRVQVGEPVRAAPPGLARRFSALVRRHRVISAVGATVLFAAALLPLLMWWTQREANAALVTANHRAQRHFALSLETIDKLLARTGAQRLLQTPGMEKVRAELLDEAVASYRGMLVEEPGSGELQRRYANGLAELALAKLQLSKSEEAEALLRQALGEFQRQDQADARVVELQRRTRRTLGQVLRRVGRIDEARPLIEGTIRELEAWRLQHPDDVSALEDLADFYTTLGGIEETAANPDASAVARGKALAIAREVVAKGPDSEGARRSLANFCLNQAVAEGEAGRKTDALALVDEAIVLLRGLHEEGDLPGRSTMLGKALGSRALLVSGDAGCAAMPEALALLEQQVRDFPSTAEKLLELASMEHNYGLLLKSTGRHEESAAQFQQARTHQLAFLKQQPNHALGLRFLGNHLANLAAQLDRLQRYDEMANVAEDMPLVAGPGPALQASLILAFCATKADGQASERLRRRSVDMLREAARRGQVERSIVENANFFDVAQDPEFETLKARLMKD